MQVIEGNLLDISEGIIVHGCNARGVMGSGIALEVKTRYPAAYEKYVAFKDLLVLGSIVPVEVEPNKWIVNGITQDGFGRDGRKYVDYQAIADVFLHTVELQQMLKNNLPIAFPRIGAGLGGGNWSVIKTIIDETVPSNIQTFLYMLPEPTKSVAL